MKHKNLLKLVGAILLAAVIAIAFLPGCAAPEEAPVQTAKPEMPYAEGVPLQPSVVPVIILSGSDYDMGYQYTQQVVQVFGTWPLELAQRELAKEDLESLKVYQWYFKQHAPEMIDYMRGMADGATDAGVTLSYEEVLTQWVWDDCSGEIPSFPNAPSESKKEKLPPKHCSGVAAWGSATKDGNLVCQASVDGPPFFSVTIIAFPETGNNFVWAQFAPFNWGQDMGGGFPAMNNKGLAYVHHGGTFFGIRARPAEDWTWGMTEGVTLMHTLRFANSANEARDMLLAFPSRDGAVGGFWADVHGDAYQFECLHDPTLIREPGDYGEVDFLYATNNALSKELGDIPSQQGPEGNTYIEHGGWCPLGEGQQWVSSSVTRNLELWNMMNKYQGEVDVDFMQMIWRFTGESPTEGEEWSRLVCEHNVTTHTLVPDDGDEGVFYTCAGPTGRTTPERRQNFWPFPTYSYYQLKLASSPSDVVSAAGGQANQYLSQANLELSKLSCLEPAYASLNELLNEAAAEWAKGKYYQNIAMGTFGVEMTWIELHAGEVQTIGKETLYNFARALRAYTKSQALARQVYNSLLPPPACPEDLGLQPYGYWK